MPVLPCSRFDEHPRVHICTEDMRLRFFGFSIPILRLDASSSNPWKIGLCKGRTYYSVSVMSRIPSMGGASCDLQCISLLEKPTNDYKCRENHKVSCECVMD